MENYILFFKFLVFNLSKSYNIFTAIHHQRRYFMTLLKKFKDKKVLYVELIFNCLNDVQELFCQ
jgi:hypothetical protein